MLIKQDRQYLLAVKKHSNSDKYSTLLQPYSLTIVSLPLADLSHITKVIWPTLNIQFRQPNESSVFNILTKSLPHPQSQLNVTLLSLDVQKGYSFVKLVWSKVTLKVLKNKVT